MRKNNPVFDIRIYGMYTVDDYKREVSREMKVCVIQPAYSVDWSRSDEFFRRELELLHQCDDSMDLIVLPEYSDIPCRASTPEEDRASIAKYNETVMKECSETAKRCNAIVFVNARQMTETGLRNTTVAIGRNGEIAGRYYKEHLVRSEEFMSKLDAEYTYEHTFPTVIEIDGLRFGFLTCYDFYFYENFANMARQNYDIIIGCSHQRSDRHSATEIMCRFLAYNTNAYVVRSSISMDESSDICGASMVVAPDGEVLINMKSRVGLETVEIDPNWKYLKPAGFGNLPSSHHEYIEIGRRAWKYRPAGSAIVRYDDVMPYPRVCAYRGFSAAAPENSLAAFGAAMALGAEKIQLLKPHINREMIEKAHKNGIRCNVFYADTEDEVRELLKLGVDTVITNDYNTVAQAVKSIK